jgi:hypothetical protein
MNNTQTTEREAKEKKAKAILALKFGLLEVGSVAYWKALADKESEV